MSQFKSKIDQVTYRTWKNEQDFLQIEKIGNQYFQAYQIDQVFNAQDQTKWLLAQNEYDPKKDFILAEYKGKPIAITTFYILKEKDGPYIFRDWLIIHPDWIETQLPSEIFDFLTEMILQAAKKLPQGEKIIHRNGYQQKEEWRKELLESKGFTNIRYFYEMGRPTNIPIPEKSLPNGLEIKPVDTKEKELTVIKASDKAFEDHFEHIPLTEEKIQAWMAQSDYNPSLWKVAWDGEKAAGSVMNFVNEAENKMMNRKRGYTEDISCLREYRGKGVASALISASIKMFRDMGMDEVTLYVDTENPSGALGLYESFGYQVKDKMVAMVKEINRN